MSLVTISLAAQLWSQPGAERDSTAVHQMLLVALDDLCPDDVLCVMVGTDKRWLDNFHGPPRHPEHWRVLLIETHPARVSEVATQHVDDPCLHIEHPTGGSTAALDLDDILARHKQDRVDLIILDASNYEPLSIRSADLESLETKLVIVTGGADHPQAAEFIDEMNAAGFDVFQIDQDLFAVNRTKFAIEASLALRLMGCSDASPTSSEIFHIPEMNVPPARPVAQGPLAIPRRMAHIWVGDRPAPVHWMHSWREMHSDWDYQLYDNAFLTGRRWRNQALIAEYFARKHFEGVSDLMRYELLLEQGGVIAEADSVCLKPIDDLFPTPSLYSVYENEAYRPGYLSPFIAGTPGHKLLEDILRDLGDRHTPETLQTPWISTGNRYLGSFIVGREDEVTIFPSHYFHPNFKSRLPYSGDGPVYADQKWGSTHRIYDSYPAEKAVKIHQEVLDAL